MIRTIDTAGMDFTDLNQLLRSWEGGAEVL